ncbi:hypothetical protein Salat_1236100 [Sesamum alatum]|uniref:Uncharacterized protein n=1 Tax=Sesamum alatum TaxID=300844 RepID=A0AAE1YG32_9LAMI|nr:hypothetical protein Salat_1236100 [Sesamum alatum]
MGVSKMSRYTQMEKTKAPVVSLSSDDEHGVALPHEEALVIVATIANPRGGGAPKGGEEHERINPSSEVQLIALDPEPSKEFVRLNKGLPAEEKSRLVELLRQIKRFSNGERGTRAGF